MLQQDANNRPTSQELLGCDWIKKKLIKEKIKVDKEGMAKTLDSLK